MADRRGTGQLEAEVLGILWDTGGWVTPGDVRTVLGGEPPLTYSTVVTILRRLAKKGVVERQRDGKGFAYQAVRTREEQAALRMAELLSSAHDPAAAIAHFVDELGADQRDQLRRALRHKEGA